MRLFAIYNRAYKVRYVLAYTIAEALTLAVQAGHIKRPQQFRKWQDLTESPPAALQPRLAALLEEDRAGLLVQDETGWQLSS